jgi:Skp family chaperone for outer membrane proteins
MKTFRSIAAAFFFAAIFTVSALAQTTPPTTPTAGKIVIIDTFAFGDDKAGITKYVTAKKSVDAEFAKDDTELKTMNTRLDTLRREIQVFNDNQTKGVPFDVKIAQAKVDEAEKIQRDMNFKSEDAKARYESRSKTVLGPITEDILKSIQDFAKQKGYSVILDAARLFDAGIILAIGDEKANVTKEFITFYNARPATTAVK